MVLRAPIRNTRGFTLVELSIVLVILGLLAGGVLAGQGLIRAAELRSITTDQQRFLIAIRAFRDQYRSLPGDMPNATLVWGAQDPTPATCQTTPSTGKATCDGNGTGGVGLVTAEYYESFRLWQQLANAGLIEGTYNGVTGSGGTLHCVPGTNCPASRLAKGGFLYSMVTSTPFGILASPNAHVLFFGAGSNSTAPNVGIIKAEDAWNIDTKLDDGKPGTGKVMGPTNTARPACVDTDVATSAVYLVTDTTPGCNLYFIDN
jgi:prepilin-type N-terminal cleavage/methylation domain-containing protein